MKDGRNDAILLYKRYLYEHIKLLGKVFVQLCQISNFVLLFPKFNQAGFDLQK